MASGMFGVNIVVAGRSFVRIILTASGGSNRVPLVETMTLHSMGQKEIKWHGARSQRARGSNTGSSMSFETP